MCVCAISPLATAPSLFIRLRSTLNMMLKTTNNKKNYKKKPKPMEIYGFDFSLAASLRIYSGISLTPEDASIASVFVLSNSLQQPEKTCSLQAANNTLPERKGESVLTNVVLDSLDCSSCYFCSLLTQAGVLSLQGLICRN